MKMCNTEVIKKIKELEERKQEIIADEINKCMSTYQTETDKIDTGYNFKETRDAIARINAEVLKLKHALNIVNSTVIVPEFNMTVGESLVYMAQLNNERAILERMARNIAKTRHTVFNGTVEYTVTNYDVNECKMLLGEIKATIVQLQLAIDRVNLSNIIDL